MERKKRRWLRGCVLLGVVLGLSALGGLAWLFWHLESARRKPGPVVVVVTYYPGMSAPSIEKTITNRIERWVNQAPGAITITSRSLAGVSIVRVGFVNDVDPDVALTLVGDLALGTLPTLPPNTLPPVVLPHDPANSEPLGVLVVSSEPEDKAALFTLAKTSLRDRLTGVPGAVAPFVLGGKDPTVVINFDPKALEAHKLSLGDVLRALKMTYGDELACAIRGDSLLLDASKRTFKAGDLHGLRVPAVDGEIVRLGDIGYVENLSERRFHIDGRPAAGVPVFLQSGASRGDVYKKLAESLPSLRQMVEDSDANLRWVPLGAEHKWLRESDDGLLKIYVRAPSNARLVETEKRVAAIEDFLKENIPANEREAILSEIGLEMDWSALLTSNSGPMDATIRVQLSGDRTLSAAEFAAKLRRGLNDDPQFTDLHVRFASRDMPAPVDIRISQGGAKKMEELAQDIRRRLAAVNGAVDVDIAQRQDAPYFVLGVNRRKAEEAGLDPADVLKQAIAALHAPASDPNLWIDGHVREELSTAILPRSDLTALDKTEVKDARKQHPFKLSSLVTVRTTDVPVEIDHHSLQRVYDVRANVEGRSRADVIADIRKMLQDLPVPEGVKVELVE